MTARRPLEKGVYGGVTFIFLWRYCFSQIAISTPVRFSCLRLADRITPRMFFLLFSLSTLPVDLLLVVFFIVYFNFSFSRSPPPAPPRASPASPLWFWAFR